MNRHVKGLALGTLAAVAIFNIAAAVAYYRWCRGSTYERGRP